MSIQINLKNFYSYALLLFNFVLNLVTVLKLRFGWKKKLQLEQTFKFKKQFKIVWGLEITILEFDRKMVGGVVCLLVKQLRNSGELFLKNKHEKLFFFFFPFLMSHLPCHTLRINLCDKKLFSTFLISSWDLIVMISVNPKLF